jgi:uncharacterized membrane-anchored protein
MINGPEENAMKKNMGTLDRSVRVIAAIGIAILIVTKTLTGTLAWVMGIIGVLLLATSAVGFCSLYVPFKFSTQKKNGSAAPHS